MASKKLKTQEEIDNSVSLAIEDLLELSILKFDDEKEDNKENWWISNEVDEDYDPISLASVIKNAKKNCKEINKEKWINPIVKKEDDIISKAKSQGKSIYDSDVLRELILQRQKKKRETKVLSSIIKKVKK